MAEITLHKAQAEIYRDLFVNHSAQYAVGVCARGFGKSYLAGVTAVSAVHELMELPASVPNKRVLVVAPTYDQVTDIYHPLIAYQLGMDDYAIKHSKDSGRFWFPRNVELKLCSYEAIERERGKGAYFVVMDEISSMTKGIGIKEAWESVVQPLITTRWSPLNASRVGAKSPGRALIISTPDGYNYLYDMFNFREVDSRWKSYHYDYHHSPYLDPEEIERIRHTIDPHKFAKEYLASFAESGSSVFYCFDRSVHVRKDLEYFKDDENVHIGIDFNVGIMASAAFALRAGQMHFLDEFSGHPDTETLAVSLKAKYGDRKILAYPDPTGNARKSSAPVGRTDFSILQSYGIQVMARPKSPPIIDSVAAVNRQLKTAAGDVSMYFHPRCLKTIKSMEQTMWIDRNPDSATIDKSMGVEHWSDGVRYPTEFLFPVLSSVRRTVQGFHF